MGQLLADDWLFNQFLAKDFALIGPFDAFFNNIAGETLSGNNHGPSLMVEVGNDGQKSQVFRSNQVLCRNLYVLEQHIGSAGDGRIRSLDWLGGHPFAAGNQEQRDTEGSFFTCSDGSGEIISIHTTRNPFLDAINDVMLAIRCQLSFTAKFSNVTTHVRFAHSQSNAFLAHQHRTNHFVAEAFFSIVQDGGKSDHHSTTQAVHQATTTHTRQLLCHDQLVERVILDTGFAKRFGHGVFVHMRTGSHQTSEITGFSTLFHYFRRDGRTV
eukprot:Lithocolla_globosa_v1_NODE_3410_length_1680_cov_11.488615.p2 type:complete len:269 gc:universal NODE_3410_length_1680_cov_11.488615:1367-561(-)